MLSKLISLTKGATMIIGVVGIIALSDCTKNNANAAANDPVFSKNTPTAIVPNPASQVEVGYSKGQGALELVLKVINQANRNLCMAAYSFTSYSIANALIRAANRGVDVKIVVDAKTNQVGNKSSKVAYLLNHGIKQIHLNHRYAIMHNKFIVIDNQSVETGSFNYSASANNKNAENVIVLWHNTSVAASYNNKCNQLYNE